MLGHSHIFKKESPLRVKIFDSTFLDRCSVHEYTAHVLMDQSSDTRTIIQTITNARKCHQHLYPPQHLLFHRAGIFTRHLMENNTTPT